MESGFKEKDKIIEEAIIKVIVFFDMFDFPLTAFEVWKYAGVQCGLAEVTEELEMIIERHSPRGQTVAEQEAESDIRAESGRLHPNFILAKERGTFYQKGVMEMKDGFYFLAGRSGIVETRNRRYNFADKKFKRAVMMAWIFKFIPWIKLIAVGNIIGGNNAKPEGDIDLFIVTEKKRIWLTRFFCVAITKLFGLRPRGNKKQDTICLSFFASETAMDFQGLMLGAAVAQSPRGDCAGTKFQMSNFKCQIKSQIPNQNYNIELSYGKNSPSALYQEGIGAKKAGGMENQPHPNPLLAKERGTLSDVYFIYWLAGLEPVYERDDAYKKFIQANSWLYECLPNWQGFAGTRWREAGRPPAFFYHDIVDLFFGGLENNFKDWQMKRLPLAIKEIMNRDTRAVVTDDILKFHVNDRREEYIKLFEGKLEKLKLN